MRKNLLTWPSCALRSVSEPTRHDKENIQIFCVAQTVVASNMMEQQYAPTNALLTNKRELDGRNETAVVLDLMNVFVNSPVSCLCQGHHRIQEPGNTGWLDLHIMSAFPIALKPSPFGSHSSLELVKQGLLSPNELKGNWDLERLNDSGSHSSKLLSQTLTVSSGSHPVTSPLVSPANCQHYMWFSWV